MAIDAIRHRSSRLDNAFFLGMAILILATVFLGFARRYYLPAIFRAPLPNLVIHIHGAVFSLWILLLIAQSLLIASGSHTDIHRRLGFFGFGLASLMVILGLIAATDSLARHFVPGNAGTAAEAFYAVPIADMLMSSTLVYFGFRKRFNPAAHKRLMLVATIALLDAAFVRWPIHAVLVGPPGSADGLLPAPADVLRFVVCWKDSSRYTLVQRASDRSATGADACRAHRSLAEFCYAGASLGPFPSLRHKGINTR